MNDFEYSVEICDRDWECFFAACEECNLLPPSLAGVDDSGMSDIDDTGSILAKSIQKVDLTAGFSEADHPIDAPPDCEGSPVEHYLSTHTVGGMESVLSGSEEDIHLQSVNIFFERLKNVTEAEGLTEPSQVRVGKNREAIKEEERCSDGQRASSSTLPKNIPKLNTLPARGETALGKETTETVHTISNNNTMKKDEAGSNISPEPAASKLFKTNKSAHPETKLSLREEICTETRVNEAKQRNGSHDSPDGVVCSQTTPHTDKVMKVNMCTPLDDVNQEHLVTSQSTHSTRCSTDSWSTLEIMSNVKWKEDRTPNSVYSDATNSNKTASQELSPSASIKRKRKKKRRLSAEPAESVHGYDRPVLVKQSDSEEEQYAWRAGSGLCISEDLFYLNEPQKNVMSSLTAYSATTNLPVKISAREIKVNDLSHYSRPSDSHYQCFPESMVRQRRCKETGLVENNATIVSSVTPLSQTDDSVMSAQNGSGNVTTNVHPCSKLQAGEPTGLNKYPMLPVSMSDSVIGKSDLATKTANCGRKDAYNLRQSDEMNNSVTCCGNEQNQGSCSAEVKSITHSILPSAESNDPTEKVSQNDKLSTAKSVLAVEAGISGRDNYALCQREAEHQQQLEIDCHNTNQYSSTVKKTHIALSESDMSGSIAHNTKPKQFKTRECPFSEEISSQLDCIKLISDTRNSLSDNNCLPKSPSSSDIKIAVQQTEHPLVRHTLSRFDVLSEKNTTAERAGLASSQIMSNHSGNLFLSGDKSLTGKSQRETKSSMSGNLLTSPSDITSVSSCCTLDTESVVSLSNENITHMSESSGLSVSQNDSGGQGEKTSLLLARHEEGDGTSGPKSQSVLNETIDSNNDLVVGAEDAITASIAQCESEKAPNSKHSVFAMSSFWSEMEKLTINDILGLRMISKAAPPSSLPPLQESEETRDSGFFTQLDEQSTKETSTNSVDSSSGSVMAVNSSSSRGMWESEPVTLSRGADVYPESMMLTSVSDISQPVFPGSAQTCLRKISKNVSVHNLHALESQSFSNTWKGQSLQTLDEGELEKVEYFADGHMSKQDKDMDSSSSSTDNY
ncbi:uncharacterized protein LOC119906252, partial [Micropterus salmoides]|uniref:uncharacterized protein LOC119906252 n=1 Tax=Micropterus salmoides TaxID=27706 RepID=UPI0018EAA147